jgi:hypothetical protein
MGRLSQWGAYAFYPERAAALYLGGIVLTLILVAALAWTPANRLRTSAQPGRVGALLGSGLLQGAVALGGTALYLSLFLGARTYAARGLPVPGSYLAIFAAIAVVSLGGARGGARGRRTAGRGRGESRFRKSMEQGGDGAQTRPKFSPFDLIVPLSIVILIYVPSWRQASGKVFMAEGSVHWDYFAMGPTLMFHHGQPLGTQILTYYGAGWPMVFSALSSWAPISYGRMIQIGSIYACIYLAGVYLLFRLLVRQPVLAVLGIVLAVAPFFFWMHGLYLWRAPNVTPMRWPFDVWCFIALIAYARSGGRVWAVAAGIFVGLAVVFNIDSGLELTAACAFWWLCLLWIRGDKTRLMSDLLSFGAVALGVGFAGLAIAGRGAIFSTRFWTGWLVEPLSFLTFPLTTATSSTTLICFVVLFFAYLALVGYSVGRVIEGRAQHFDVFNGLYALYGLLVLVKFVRFASDQTLPRLLTPAAILLTILTHRASVGAGVSLSRGRWGMRRFGSVLWSLGYAAAGLVVLIGIAVPRSRLVDPVLAYPNLISAQVRGSRPDGVCLMSDPKDICGLPAKMAGTAVKFRAIADRIQTLTSAGKTFAVIDETGSLFFLATNSPPFGRYSRIFTTAYTKQLLGEVTEPFRRHPDYILTRLALDKGSPDLEQWSSFGTGPRSDSRYEDTWDALEGIVHEDYSLDATVGPFQLWRLGHAGVEKP